VRILCQFISMGVYEVLSMKCFVTTHQSFEVITPSSTA
jgi:hypothetical protein